MDSQANQPRWLDEREQAAWLALVEVIMRLPAALDAELQRDAAVSHYDYLVMAMLSEAPGRTLQMKELASASVSSMSRLSHEMARLERRGWVERRPCPSDGRAVNATLTEAGMSKLVATAPLHVAEVRRLVFDRLGAPQVDQLQQLAAQISEGISEGDF